ncbi:thiamine ABC transporter substrate-binding protein, partial [bacterium]|nr:thiamine ABC transporter substrate-binding protein [bacterium]
MSSAIAALSAAILVLSVSALALGCQSGGAKNLTVWTYDSFVSEWGPAAKLAALYEQKTGVKVEFVSKGDGGALLAALKNEGAKADADLVVGLDNNLAPAALKTGFFAPLKLSNLSKVDKKLIVDDKNRLVPYDYGDFAFIWDSESKIAPPASLEDLTKPEYAKKVIIMDPRTSTPGLGLLAWTQAVYKDGWRDYWKRLAPSVLAMTPG